MKSKFFTFFLILYLCGVCAGYAQSDRPALAVLVSNSQSRAVKTRLAQGLASQHLAEAFYGHCLNILTEDLETLASDFQIFICPAKAEDQAWARARWPHFHILTKLNNNDLGHCIHSIMTTIQQQGYDKVLLIGSDAPSLPVDYIRECYNKLKTHDVVFGPADDGGYYLIGTRLLLPDLITVRWKDMAPALEARQLSIGLGPIWYDVDYIEDLWHLEKDFVHQQGARKQLEDWLAQLQKVSIIIPVLNEKPQIEMLVSHLSQLEPEPEIIFVDGGSQDGTVAEIRRLGFLPLISQKANRGHQLNMGARAAHGAVLLFLHVDTMMDQKAYSAMLDSLSHMNILGGAFSYRLKGSEEDWRLRMIEKGVYLRTHGLNMPYGDQGFFIKRGAWDEVIGPFQEIALMEDVEWFKRLKDTGQYLILPETVATSPRRILKRGWLKSSMLNLWLVTLYQLGMDPETLAHFYYGNQKPEEEIKEISQKGS